MPARLTSNYRYMLILLFLINALNFFDRAIPSVVIEPMRIEFGLNDKAIALTATAFTLLHAVVGIPMGRLADVALRTRVIAVGVFCWSLFTALSGVAWNYLSFMVARAAVGIGEASCVPAANSMISDLVPPSKRARATGFFMLGFPIGTFACYYVVGAIAKHSDWRLPFYLAAVPGVLLALLILVAPEPRRGAQEAGGPEASPGIGAALAGLLRTPTVAWICVFGSLVTAASYAMAMFLPAFLIRVHGLPIDAAGQVSGLVLGITGLVGLTAGGWLADRVHQAFARGRLMLGALAMLVAAPLLWTGLGAPVGQLRQVIVPLTAGWLLYYLYFVTVYPSLMEVVSVRQRGTAMAIFYFFANVIGGGLGSLLTGALSDHFAEQAMVAAGAAQLTAQFRAAGLGAALQWVIPPALLLGGLALLAAAKSFKRDSAASTMAADVAVQG